MKVSQYNHICQVFECTLFRYRKVFNIMCSLEMRFFFKLLDFIKLSYIPGVDIPVDKYRCLLHAITLRCIL